MYGQIIEEGVIKGDLNSPIAQLTKFGWIISGPTTSELSNPIFQGCHVSIDQKFHDFFQRFWELEEIPNSSTSPIRSEEQECEELFKSLYTWDDQGRYVVRLPFKQPTELLGESRTKAVRILNHLSKKLSSDSMYAQ